MFVKLLSVSFLFGTFFLFTFCLFLRMMLFVISFITFLWTVSSVFQFLIFKIAGASIYRSGREHEYRYD